MIQRRDKVGPLQEDEARKNKKAKHVRKQLAKYGFPEDKIKFGLGEIPRATFQKLIEEHALLPEDVPQHKEEKRVPHLIHILTYRVGRHEIASCRMLEILSESFRAFEPEPRLLNLASLTPQAGRFLHLVSEAYVPVFENEMINDLTRAGRLARVELATKPFVKHSRFGGNGVEKLTVDVLSR